MIDFGLGVALSTIDERNLEKMRTWRNSRSINRWCRQNNLISQLDQKKWFERIHFDPTIRMFSIINSKYEFVGVCGLTDIDFLNSRAEFSLYIGTEHQRMGYASRGLKSLFTHGFQDMGLNLIWGETFADNKAQHLFEKLGMKPEGRRRSFYYKEGQYHDAILYSILKCEFVGDS